MSHIQEVPFTESPAFLGVFLLIACPVLSLYLVCIYDIVKKDRNHRRNYKFWVYLVVINTYIYAITTAAIKLMST